MEVRQNLFREQLHTALGQFQRHPAVFEHCDIFRRIHGLRDGSETGQALFGRAGLWSFGGTWMAYSLVNEFAMHGPEGERERNLNLVSRLGLCAVILLIDLLRNGF